MKQLALAFLVTALGCRDVAAPDFGPCEDERLAELAALESAGISVDSTRTTTGSSNQSHAIHYHVGQSYGVVVLTWSDSSATCIVAYGEGGGKGAG